MINEIKNQNLNKVYPQNDSKIGALNGFPSTAVKKKIDFYKHLYESQTNKYFQFSVPSRSKILKVTKQLYKF